MARRLGAGDAELLAGLAGTVVVRVANILLTVLTPFVLARLLSASGYGAYAYAVAWVLLLGAVSVGGLDQLAIRELSSARARGAGGEAHYFLRWAVIRVGGLSLAVLTFAGNLMAAVGPSLGDELGAPLSVAVFAVPLLALVRLSVGINQGLRRVVLGQVLQQVILPAGTLVACTALYLWTGLQARGAVFGYTTAATLALLAGAMIALERARHLPAPAQLADATHR